MINGSMDVRPIFGKNLDMFSLTDMQILCLEKDFVCHYGRKLGDYDIDEVLKSFNYKDQYI